MKPENPEAFKLGQSPNPADSPRLGAGRKGEILRAAAAVFGKKGYDAGSMRDIASRVGVSEPALYRHFSGKEALFLALLEVMAEQVRGEAMRLISQLEAARLREQIVEALTDRRRLIATYLPVIRTVFSAVAFNEVFLARYRELVVLPMQQTFLDRAEQLDRDFGIERDPAERQASVRALMALIVGYFVSSAVLADEPEEAMADAVLNVMGYRV